MSILASNHIDTAKLTVSSISSLANMPAPPRLCEKVHTQSDSVPPTVLKEVKNWVLYVSKYCKLEDGLLYYHDEYMEDPSHFCIFVPNDTNLQRHLLKVYHNSPAGMHRGRDSAYACLS